jgi:hypothetical protein
MREERAVSNAATNPADDPNANTSPVNPFVLGLVDEFEDPARPAESYVRSRHLSQFDLVTLTDVFLRGIGFLSKRDSFRPNPSVPLLGSNTGL